MNSHKSRARRRRLAHASGIFRRYVHDNRSPNRLLRETHLALRRAGWSFDRSDWPIPWLADRGFYPTL